MKDSELRNRTREFALEIIRKCDSIDSSNGRYVLVKQIIRSSTSIGANICEANYAASRLDFINKLHIALKECAETEYWLDILSGAGCLTEKETRDLINKCGIIRRMLVKSINTAKSNE